MSYYRWAFHPYQTPYHPHEFSLSQAEREALRDCMWCCLSPCVMAWNWIGSTITNVYETTYQWLVDPPPNTRSEPEEHMLQEFP